MSNNYKHYDFIEIGTSDFDTLIQTSDENTVGISIEPIKYYLDNLPNKSNVIKVNAACSDINDNLNIYYIKTEDIQNYNLPYWVRGCNSINKPHSFTREKIGEELYDEIVTIDNVPTITWSDIISNYNVGSIGYLKIDTEGYDHIILKSYFDICKNNPELLAQKIMFEYNETSNKEELDILLSNLEGYHINVQKEDVVLTKIDNKLEKSFVLYTNELYYDIADKCIKSIREYSNLPIFVYTLDFYREFNYENVKTIKWDCNIGQSTDSMYIKYDNNFYINRDNKKIYTLLIQRPLIVKDVLEKYSKTIAYIDTDSIATKYVDTIFDYFNNSSTYPYFVEGIYDFLMVNGRGGASNMNDLTTTLEHPVCELFNINQYNRKTYRQTGYFVANENCIPFLEEWYWMCINPTILKNNQYYAPFNEETIVNALLWKYNFDEGLPYIYVNGGTKVIERINKTIKFLGSGIKNNIEPWIRIPETEDKLLFYHGEKNINEMQNMIQVLKNKKIKILFLAPHLSTGGMPSFLLKRIECLLEYSDLFEIFVVEYSDLSPEYIVQKNKIKNLIPSTHFWTLGENKLEVIDIIKNNDINIVHLDEMLESFDSFNKVSTELMNRLYDNNRTWKIVETCHNIYFDPNQSKKFHPESYSFCTPYHKEKTFTNMPSYGEVIEFPIDNITTTEEEKLLSKIKLGLDLTKKHIINVGLWTQGKNQKEGIEIARLLEQTNPELQFHFIGNQAPNFQEYWKPIMEDIPSNVIVWGERDDVDLFMKSADILMFNSTWECNPLVLREGISYGLKILSRNLPQYMDMFTQYITPIDDDLDSTKNKLLQLLDGEITYIPPTNQSEIFAKKHENLYLKVNDMGITQQEKITSNIEIIQYFVEKPFLEIKGTDDGIYNIKFRDENGIIHYENNLPLNRWVRLNREYYTKWNTQISKDNNLIYDNTLDYTGKRVYIAFDSKSLGDSIAWIPYALEFKKKHKCDVIVSTFWNKLFKNRYPELEFVEPGVMVHNIYGMYKLGWFYDSNKEPELPNTIPLQKTATNILGLDFTEIKPEIDFIPKVKPFNTKYVTIANESTAGLKLWNNQNGWQELVDYIVSKGYKVINVSKNGDKLNNVTQLKDTSIENTMNCIHHSEFFIGLSSGLSWLSWAIGKHVVMISNFTEPDHEFTSNCARIVNNSVCNGCWNKPQFKFDKGDWNWCPEHKNTERQFECHKSISSEMVINQIQHLFN